MVAGHLQIKKGYYYAVLSWNSGEKRQTKWIPLGLPEKPNTVIHYHAIIHSALKYAVKTDMIIQNVADKVDRPKKNDFQPVFLSAEEAQELNKKVCGNCYNYDYDGYVFVDEMGERMKANYLTSRFPEVLEKKGLRRMRFHDLRHSCASLLLANGVPLKHIQEWLGHSDFSTTANIYAHLDYCAKITSAQAMESGLSLPDSGGFESRWSIESLN